MISDMGYPPTQLLPQSRVPSNWHSQMFAARQVRHHRPHIGLEARCDVCKSGESIGSLFHVRMGSSSHSRLSKQHENPSISTCFHIWSHYPSPASSLSEVHSKLRSNAPPSDFINFREYVFSHWRSVSFFAAVPLAIAQLSDQQGEAYRICERARRRPYLVEVRAVANDQLVHAKQPQASNECMTWIDSSQPVWGLVILSQTSTICLILECISIK